MAKLVTLCTLNRLQATQTKGFRAGDIVFAGALVHSLEKGNPHDAQSCGANA